MALPIRQYEICTTNHPCTKLLSGNYEEELVFYSLCRYMLKSN